MRSSLSTPCATMRKASSGRKVQALFRARAGAVLSAFLLSLGGRLLLIGSSISFCPAAALRGFLPFTGAGASDRPMLRFEVIGNSFPTFGIS